ncbi:DEAD/DEAH box helicase [Marinimicrobium sp. ABcell2]|uniref:DEAD/DEAH box helicase n=1 Tax=Marinimicrobium sp. ABcell2 TaxID=3069751 RepID=UPI0027B5EE3E|nr:DEAD/DEAH box helicase [Marinimicrobium sp. ABcell2]MDQ2075498.1 DEAD/DEAH box helicase [Marinimicrobium sp. ABcell2]
MTSDITNFSDLGLSPQVLQAIQSVGYEQPSPIQAAAIPALLAGEDILGTAQTGTGKTAAFALPLLSRLDASQRAPQILVLAPTRELAIQVAEAFQRYAKDLPGFHVLPIYGGQEMSGQLRQLKRGVQVVVGTPGRVMDHISRGSLDLSQLKSLVLDEADEMLRMGFIDDVEWILEHIPKERQTALFSATMPPQIRKVANRYMRNPKEIKIASSTSTGDNIEQVYWMVSGTNKMDALTRILEVEPFDGMIIFVRTKTATVELAEKLEARGYSSSALNGDMNQALRERTVERLKSGKLDIVIATDVAARGLDVERVSHVVNYDIPYDSEAYVHRIGRTGRAGRTGKAILFVAPREKRLLYVIEKATRQPIKPMELPSGETVTAHRIDSFKGEIDKVFAEQVDLSFYHELLAAYSHDNDRYPEDIAAALAHLLQKERPLQVTFAPIKPERDHKRSERGERGERGDRNERPSKGKKQHSDEDMQRYRIEVGRNHQAKPGDIVGALANEGGISSRQIGHIKLFDDFSTVDLPKTLAKETLRQLQKVRVRNKALEIRIDEGPGGAKDFGSKPPKKFERKSKAPKRAPKDKG